MVGIFCAHPGAIFCYRRLPATETLKLRLYGQPLTFSFHSAACSGCGLAFTAFGTRVGCDGVVERLNGSQSADRRGLLPGFRIEEAQLRATPRPRFPASRSQALSVSEFRKCPSCVSAKRNNQKPRAPTSAPMFVVGDRNQDRLHLAVPDPVTHPQPARVIRKQRAGLFRAGSSFLSSPSCIRKRIRPYSLSNLSKKER